MYVLWVFLLYIRHVLCQQRCLKMQNKLCLDELCRAISFSGGFLGNKDHPLNAKSSDRAIVAFFSMKRERNKFISGARKWLQSILHSLTMDCHFPSEAHYGTFRPSEPSWMEIYN